jgi:hypothetical protein
MNWSRMMRKNAKKLLKQIEKQIVRKPKILPEDCPPLILPLRHPQTETPEEILKQIPPVPPDLL